MLLKDFVNLIDDQLYLIVHCNNVDEAPPVWKNIDDTNWNNSEEAEESILMGTWDNKKGNFQYYPEFKEILEDNYEVVSICAYYGEPDYFGTLETLDIYVEYKGENKNDKTF